MLKMVPTAGDILQIQDASGCEQTWVVFHQRCPYKLPLHTLLFIHLIDNSLIHTSKRPDAYHIISYKSYHTCLATHIRTSSCVQSHPSNVVDLIVFPRPSCEQKPQKRKDKKEKEKKEIPFTDTNCIPVYSI